MFERRTMKSALYLALAVALVVVCSNDVSAQTFNGGYQFGAGFSAGFPYPGRSECGQYPIFGNRIGVLRRQEAPPYFAQFPPVYYNGIVRRPYGVSPYAAPAGITPVEMQMKVEPVTVSNPYLDNEISPASKPKAKTKKVENKVTRITNPFINQPATSIVSR